MFDGRVSLHSETTINKSARKELFALASKYRDAYIINDVPDSKSRDVHPLLVWMQGGGISNNAIVSDFLSSKGDKERVVKISIRPQDNDMLAMIVTGKQDWAQMVRDLENASEIITAAQAEIDCLRQRVHELEHPDKKPKGRPVVYDAAVHEEIISMHDSGMSIRKIAQNRHMSTGTVYKILRKGKEIGQQKKPVGTLEQAGAVPSTGR